MYMIQLKSRGHGGHVIVTLASQVSSGVCLNHTCEHTCTCMHAQAEMYAHTYPHTHTHTCNTYTGCRLYLCVPGTLQRPAAYQGLNK